MAGQVPVHIVPKWTGDGGEFAVSLVSGIIAGPIGANSPLLSARWVTPPTEPAPPSGQQSLVLRLKSVKPRIVVTVAFSPAADADLGLFKATGFSAADSGGTISIPAAGKNQKFSLMKSTQIADLRIASTTALAAGARVLDTLPMKSWGGWGGAVGQAFPADEAIMAAYREYPATFGNQEGFVLANLTAIPATGSIVIYCDLVWEEINLQTNTEEA